jgi:hypothetical protein
MKYRVYQNMTEFAIDVEANSKKEAIEKASSRENFAKWQPYEANEDNITYEAVNMDLLEKSDREKELMNVGAINIVENLLSALEELFPDWYADGDVAEANDWLKWATGKIEDEEAQTVSKNLTGFNF